MQTVGTRQNIPMYLCQGRFGLYIAWNNMNFSCNKYTKEQITTEFADECVTNGLLKKNNANENKKTRIYGPRILSPSLKLCKRRDGVPYVLYTASGAEAARFGFNDFRNGNPLSCPDEVILQWLNDKYGIW